MRAWMLMAVLCAVPAHYAQAAYDASNEATFAGYVCAVHHWPHNPGTPTLGRYGHVLLRMAKTPECTEPLGVYFCSLDATNPTACDLDWTYTERALMSLHAALQRAMIAEHTVWLWYTPNEPNPVHAGRAVQFFAPGATDPP